MTDNVEPTPDHGIRHSTFVGVTVAFLVFLYLFSPLTQVFLGWFVDFEDNINHRVHEVTFGALFTIIFVGVLAQLSTRSRNFAGLLQAIIAALILSIVIAASTGWEWTALLYLIPLGAMVWLHPNRNDLFRYRLRPHRGMLVAMALITYSLFDGFQHEFGKAANEVGGHRAHWIGMAAFALTLLILGYLAALRLHGWPILAWTTGISVILYAVVSLRFRFDASARPDLTAVLAIIWGVAFLYTARRAAPIPALRRDDPRGTTQPDTAPKKPGVALVTATVFAVALNVIFGPSGSELAFPTLVLALILVGTVIRRWWRWRRASRSPRFAETPPSPPGERPSPLKRAAPLAGFAALLLVGAFGGESARQASPPPVPHAIDSTARSSCLSCHATGEQDATKINQFSHPYDDGEAPGRCADCHDTLPITPTAAAGSSPVALWNNYAGTRAQASIGLAPPAPADPDRVSALVRAIDGARSP